MLHNNHIIKTLSNTILSFSLACLLFNSTYICAMGSCNPVKAQIKEEFNGPDGLIPSPAKPPFK